MSEQEASAFVSEQARRGTDERGAWHGRVVELIAERRVIGDVGVWVPPEGSGPVVGDLGFQFDPRYHGQGYALEALGAFVPVAFRVFALDRVTATCQQENRSSWRLMERLGMQLQSASDGERGYALERD